MNTVVNHRIPCNVGNILAIVSFSRKIVFIGVYSWTYVGGTLRTRKVLNSKLVGVTVRMMKCIRMEKRHKRKCMKMIVLYKLLVEFW